ncbi:type II toxin-antitoxin system antitoxin SocA domain-containing protein [Chitinophaga sp.]|uniref:Panacea domain-containing protein n=1 Tax=Chitinophaga sp. TaxID=1869181 RepID=UPI0031E084E9
MIYNVKVIANWFLTRMVTDAGDTMSHLKLQKLLYYAQAWHLAFYNKPLFKEKIEPWSKGPVVPCIYDKFKDLPFESAINPFKDYFDIKDPDFSDEARHVLEQVHTTYGEHSAGYLQELACREFPYRNARKGLGFHEISHGEISHKVMTNYYRKRLQYGKYTSQKKAIFH